MLGGHNGTTIAADVVVVGLGAVGLAAAAELASRGRRVVGFDQFPHDHAAGSSHGAERIMRLPYADPTLVDLAVDSLDGWRRWERDSGEELLKTTGGIDTGDVGELVTLAEQCSRIGRPALRLSRQEATRRFAGFVFDDDVLWQPDAGRIQAETTQHWLRIAAAANGAELHPSTAVLAIDCSRSDRVKVVTQGPTVEAEVCIITVGAWAASEMVASSLPASAVLPELSVTEEHVAFFRQAGDLEWPTFIYRHDPTMYGLETSDGHIKVGEHHVGPQVDPDDRPLQPDDRVGERLSEWVRSRLRGVDPTAVRSTNCLYASYPGDSPLLDRTGSIVVGLGLSGHGFKFLPELGRRLADLADNSGSGRKDFGFDRRPVSLGESGHP